MMLHPFKVAFAALAVTITTASTTVFDGAVLSAQNDRGTQSARSNTPLTVTGCLQRDGRTFIVTRKNEPAQKNAGSTGNGGAVEREQLRAAANAYRVSPAERMDLDKMVGK